MQYIGENNNNKITIDYMAYHYCLKFHQVHVLALESTSFPSQQYPQRHARASSQKALSTGHSLPNHK